MSPQRLAHVTVELVQPDLNFPENGLDDPAYIAPCLSGFHLCTFAHTSLYKHPSLTLHTCSRPLVLELRLEECIDRNQKGHKLKTQEN